MAVATREGVVIARHRREAVVELADGASFTALVKGRKLRPLTGDRVLLSQQNDGTAVIREILPRSSVLERIDSRGRGEGVAANLSLICVVVAPAPAPDWQLVDRYLVAAALAGTGAALVRNKADIADTDLDARASTYRQIGYRTLVTSAASGRGIADLADLLSTERSVFVGQSGVGKSSLLNCLLNESAQAVGELSRKRALGRHTTTAAILYRLPGGGELIDSPGVRRYAPNITDPADLARGFVEFQPLIPQCRFNDCRHRNEPDCAVRSAVASGDIQPERYASYCALSDTLEKLREL